MGAPSRVLVPVAVVRGGDAENQLDGLPVTPLHFQSVDATATPTIRYERLLAQRVEESIPPLVDPLTITGPAYGPASPRLPETQVAVTAPVPEYQPLPELGRYAIARLSLMVGPDGRVREVSVRQGVGEETDVVVEAVRSWRFSPATENGHPVSAPYSVDISFEGT